MGYLYGIPITVKNMIISKGAIDDCGNAAHLDEFARYDGLLIKLLKD